MVFEKIPSGAGQFNIWHVNGKQYPHEREFVLQQGARYRLVFRNRTDDSHPVHLHRHLFELVDVNGKPTGGIMKDTVVVPLYGRVTVDLVADQPGCPSFTATSSSTWTTASRRFSATHEAKASCQDHACSCTSLKSFPVSCV